MTGQWFSPGTPAASTNKTTTIYIVTEILLKVVLNTLTLIMTKRKRTNGQTVIYKTLHRKLNIEQHEPCQKNGLNSVPLV